MLCRGTCNLNLMHRPKYSKGYAVLCVKHLSVYVHILNRKVYGEIYLFFQRDLRYGVFGFRLILKTESTF
jgi:hypothetical protein